MLCVCLCEDMLDFQTRRGEERAGGREGGREMGRFQENVQLYSKVE